MARGHRFPDDAFPIVVAHRGASSTRPENTIPSFEEAIRLGAGIVEFDVRLSRDGVPVVIHDAAADRTTAGNGPRHDRGLVGFASRLSGDGVPVVIHDAAVDRTTDGNGLVHELGAAELSSLNAGTEPEPTPVPPRAEV